MLTLYRDPLSASNPQEQFETEAQEELVFCVAIFSQTIAETSLNVNCSIFSKLCGQKTVFFSRGENVLQ